MSPGLAPLRIWWPSSAVRHPASPEFQLAIVSTRSFGGLATTPMLVHATSFLLVALVVILSMAPAVLRVHTTGPLSVGKHAPSWQRAGNRGNDPASAWACATLT